MMKTHSPLPQPFMTKYDRNDLLKETIVDCYIHHHITPSALTIIETLSYWAMLTLCNNFASFFFSDVTSSNFSRCISSST